MFGYSFFELPPPHHLSGIIDAGRVNASSSGKRTEVSHIHAIWAGDEGMTVAASGYSRYPHHLSGIIDVDGTAGITSQSTQVSYAHAIWASDEGMIVAE